MFYWTHFQVSKERGEELAIEYGIKFMETSAKASINVEEAFFTLARDIKAKMEKKLVRQLELSTYKIHSMCIAVWLIPIFSSFPFNEILTLQQVMLCVMQSPLSVGIT